MKYVVRLSEETQWDIESATKWYNSEKDGLGLELYDEVIVELDFVATHPKAFPKKYKEFHQAKVGKRFPYSLFYTVDHDKKEILVVSLFHHSRRPELWIERLKKKEEQKERKEIEGNKLRRKM